MKSHSILLLTSALLLGLLLSTNASAEPAVKRTKVINGVVFTVVEVDVVVPDPIADDPFGDDIVKPPVKKPSKSDPASKTSAPVTATEPPIDPEIVQLHLRDGMIVSGKFSVKAITVLTSYGPLQVPISKLRSFTPGLSSTPELSGQIASLVEQLGSDEFATREQSQKQLLAMGLPIRAVLARHSGGSNVEQARRVKAILEKLNELADEGDEGPEDDLIEGDKIATTAFTMIGDISPKTFQFYSKYGPLSINLGDIRIAKRSAGGPALDDVRKSLTLGGRAVFKSV
jgi:hypothetical protein